MVPALAKMRKAVLRHVNLISKNDVQSKSSRKWRNSSPDLLSISLTSLTVVLIDSLIFETNFFLSGLLHFIKSKFLIFMLCFSNF